MFIADALLVASHSLNCENTLFFGKKFSVQLIVWNDKEKNDSDDRCQKSVEEEDDLPWSHCETMLNSTGSDTICN